MINRTDSDDGGLITAAREGNRTAFDGIIERHAPRLLTLATRMLGNRSDAEDAVQNAMASAWLALHRFDESREVAPWLTTITLNKCRDAIRSRRLTRVLKFGGDETAAATPDDRPDQERDLAGRLLLSQVQHEISRLPAKLKEPFILVTFDARSHAEASAILGISEKAVETRIYRARTRLRQKFENS